MAAAPGRGYVELLERIHRHVVPRGYLEIGVKSGESLRRTLPGTVCVGVDPAPEIARPLSRSTVFALTSDDFFAQHDQQSALRGQPLDLAFIDGMHLFEFALRDLMNIERWSHPATTVLIHDVNPIDEAGAARERTTRSWTGDVWKTILCLREHRPDLDVATIDIGPSGLGIVTNLDPTSTVLHDRYDELVDTYVPMGYDVVESQRAEVLNLVSADWDQVVSRLPSRPFRAALIPRLEDRRRRARRTLARSLRRAR
jgi:hypothetical protein